MRCPRPRLTALRRKQLINASACPSTRPCGLARDMLIWLLRCFVLLCVGFDLFLSGSSKPSSDFASRRCARPRRDKLTLDGFQLKRKALQPDTACLHVLSSFQRTGCVRRPFRARRNGPLRPAFWPCSGEPSKVTIDDPLCQHVIARFPRPVQQGWESSARLNCNRTPSDAAVFSAGLAPSQANSKIRGSMTVLSTPDATSTTDDPNQMIVFLALPHQEQLAFDRLVRRQTPFLVSDSTVVHVDAATADQPRGFAL